MVPAVLDETAFDRFVSDNDTAVIGFIGKEGDAARQAGINTQPSAGGVRDGQVGGPQPSQVTSAAVFARRPLRSKSATPQTLRKVLQVVARVARNGPSLAAVPPNRATVRGTGSSPREIPVVGAVKLGYDLEK